MLKRLLGVWMFLAIFPAVPCFAEEMRVLVLPFEIHTKRDASSLQSQIADLVEKRLTEDGLVIVPFVPSGEDDVKRQETSGLEYYRALGRNAAADFVVSGSYTEIGKRYSMDAKVVEVYSDAPALTIYSEGSGAETLVDSVAAMAKDIAVSVLRLEKVVEVIISGNRRIESEAIKRLLKTKSGDLFSSQNIREDVKAVYKMGYFGDVEVDVAETPGGKKVTFSVAEKETVRYVRFEGNRRFEDEKLEEVIGTRPGAILNVNTLQRDLEEIRRLYRDKGYHHVGVHYEVEPSGEKQANIVYNVEEGEKAYVKTITFEGNEAFDDDELRDEMETTEKGFFSWITSSGDLNNEILDQDISKIAAFYHNHGYIQVRVGAPDVAYDKDSIAITVKIDEGPQFNVGEVGIEGDLVFPEDELLSKIKTKKGDVYNREVVREDILALTDAYVDQGYAYAAVSPRIEQHETSHLADISYVITKKGLVYFEKIIIAGNTKTRDKVIRRELKVYEQELFSGKALKEGTRKLYRLDYFEDIKVDTSQGSADDKMVLKLDVTEKPTGAFSFGGGYSSVDNLFAVGSISQRNLFGRGQILELKSQLGGATSTYSLSFTEPWLFDIPLTAGSDLYNLDKDYDTYEKSSIGGTLRASYPVFEYTRAFFSYNYDRSTIEELTDDASSSIREWEGTNTGHTVRTGLGRDTRDRVFNPTEGSENRITIEHAGTPFGGDYGYTKYTGQSGWYIPLFWKTVGFINGEVGFIHGDAVGDVPTWERFYLGGMNSVRGYDWRDIGPEDPETGDPIGGNKMVQLNLEFLFPLIEESGLRGVLFYDTGNAYDNGEDIDVSNLRESVGGGIRWYSPIGPIRLEYGYILDSEKRGEGGWEFSMGMGF